MKFLVSIYLIRRKEARGFGGFMELYFGNVNENFSYADQVLVHFTHHFAVFLLNLISYAYVAVKFYKVFCYSKMTFEWLPLINPYVWPFSVFHALTQPYFAFWAKILPSIKFDKSSVEISGIIALESLNSLIYVLIRLATVLIDYLDSQELDLPELDLPEPEVEFLDKIN